MSSNFPSVGVEIPCASHASDVPLRVDVLGIVLLDFKGGWKDSKLTVFPPQRAVYQLQAPVDLAPVGAPSQVGAQLQQLPLTVSHNP
ncbi:hypothetical protein [Sorangium sp. So ce1151]|uniref:hypothetical protein n=1 Tax=Sorangium sp. So ce1151 TaxID=3133332 RepID=UPI003F61DCB7